MKRLGRVSVELWINPTTSTRHSYSCHMAWKRRKIQFQTEKVPSYFSSLSFLLRADMASPNPCPTNDMESRLWHRKICTRVKRLLADLVQRWNTQAQQDRKFLQTEKMHFALQFMYKYAAVGDTSGCLGEGRHGTRRRRSRTHAFHSGWAHRASRDAEEFLIRRQRIRGNTSTF